MRKRSLLLPLYLVFTVLPVYWMVSTSLKTPTEIASTFTYWPQQLTWDNYKAILADRSWYGSYLDSLVIAAIGTVLAMLVALPAAYAFSRHAFIGRRQIFFWLLANRMMPPAVLLLPFLQLYTTLRLMDTHLAVALAHLAFNLPLAVWILEGFISAVPREIDETAFMDGYSFPRFFLRILLPQIRAGITVAAAFCFMLGWTEFLLARALTSADTRPLAAVIDGTGPAAGTGWGVLAAAGVLASLPGVVALWLVRRHIATGLAMGRRLD